MHKVQAERKSEAETEQYGALATMEDMMLDSIDQQGHIHTKCRHGGVARNLAMTRGRQLQCLSLSLRQCPCHFKFNVQELAILYLFYIVIMFMSLKLHGIVECSSRYTKSDGATVLINMLEIISMFGLPCSVEIQQFKCIYLDM